MEFENAYSELNDRQREAVETLDGPVLVIAGPGTGKTQLLSMRVANILKKTDTEARNILCLTFTNKAAVNMRERLNKLTGGEARDATIKTFHAFAADIMNSYPEKFWSGANLESAPDGVQLAILQDIFASLPKDNPFSVQFDGKFTMIKNASDGIKLAKEAGLTPEKLRTLLEFNLAYIDEIEPQMVDLLSDTLSYKKLPQLQDNVSKLPSQQLDSTLAPLLELASVIKEGFEFAMQADEGTNKTKHVGEWKRRWVQKEQGEAGMFKLRRSNQRWLALADIYEAYRSQLHSRGYYDYSDMLLEVITMVEQDSELKSDIQERYNYVLVDEFQDSNAAQLRLAHLVADHHSADGLPNIMAVGDDDQSIYGFNGAELNNLLYFDRNFKAVNTIVLTENYRSSQEILDIAEKTIELCEDRLVTRLPHLTKHLVAKNAPNDKGVITHMVFDDVDQQYYQLSREITDWRSQRPEDSIAVLSRQNKSLVQMAGLLNQQHTPITFEKGQNILQLEAVQLVQAIMTAVEQIAGGDEQGISHTLSQLLPHPMWLLDPDMLWEIARDNRYQSTWLEAMQHRPETKPVGDWLQRLARHSSTAPLEQMLEYIIGIRKLEDEGHESPIKAYFIDNQGDSVDHEYLKTLSGIRVLRQAVKEAAAAETTTVHDWLKYTQTMEANEQIISDQSVFASGENAVQLLTVHKAKGLEFDRIYIIDAQDSFWRPKAERNQPPANLPLRPPLETMDDYARLMYVAITRAKRDLIVSSFRYNLKGEELLATPLVEHIETTHQKNDPGQAIETLEHAIAWPRLASANEKQLLQPVLDTFTINPTNLINFLDISEGGPEKFLVRNLLRLPSTKNESMSHGTAMHSALELAQKLTNRGTFEFKKIVAEYERKLKKEQLPPEAFAVQLKEGERILRHLFETLQYQLPKGSIPERSLQQVVLGEARIGGKLDRIDTLDEQTIRIVDYKTGKPLSSFETKDKTKAINAWKHKLQLTFYALLTKNHPDYGHFANAEGQMVYLHAETNEQLTLSYAPTQEEIERLSSVIQAVWQMVQTYELPDTSRFTPDIVGIIDFEDYILDTFTAK